MKNLATGKIPSSIKGFNRETSTLSSIRVFNPKSGEHDITGWKTEFTCGTEKKFLNTHFHDAYGAARSAIENHYHKEV
jgi:hypothetical protein